MGRGDMAMTNATEGYCSPVSKLVRFFRRSRDQWKQKCRQAKQYLKRAKQRAQQIAASRDRWKLRAGKDRRDCAEPAKNWKS